MSDQDKTKQPKEPSVTIVCREAGLDCDFVVHDSDEHEVLASAQAHVKRKHGADYSFEQLRPLMHSTSK